MIVTEGFHKTALFVLRFKKSKGTNRARGLIPFIYTLQKLYNVITS